jgi:DNA repair protein RadC
MKNNFIPQFKVIKSESIFQPFKITNSADVVNFATKLIDDQLDVCEQFYIITLNRANLTTGFAFISSGNIYSTMVDIRLIAKIAVDNLAAGVILVHNHPSGNTSPSISDDNLTLKIKSALAFFDINVLDHLIIGSCLSYASESGSNYFSYADNARSPLDK